jgi:hypothetical protein
MCGNDCIYHENKTISTSSRKLQVSSYDALYDITSRMFCLTQTITFGDNAMHAFKESIICEANAIWNALDDILKEEQGM